jgi:hypothetical protein
MNHKKLLIRIFLFTFILCSTSSTTFASPPIDPSRPNIGKAEDLQIIRDIIDNLDKKTLVVFDVDDTLIRKKKEQGYPSISNGADLIHDTTPQLIRDLQEKEVKVIALTHNLSEKETMNWLDSTQGEIMPFYQFRFRQLAQEKIGIDFSGAFPNIEHTYLSISTAFSTCFHISRHPCFYKGIIFTNTISKGIVLSAFLDQFGSNLNLIIFIDDQLPQNIAVAKSLEKMGYTANNPERRYFCLHYIAAQH